MDWNTPPPPQHLEDNEKQQKVRKNNHWKRQRPAHIGVLKAKAENAWTVTIRPSNQVVTSVEKSCWIHSPPWPPDFARDPSVLP